MQERIKEIVSALIKDTEKRYIQALMTARHDKDVDERRLLILKKIDILKDISKEFQIQLTQVDKS